MTDPRITTLDLADDTNGIARACALLRAGELVAFATETVYGLGADATNPDAVAAIYTAKSRPHFNPLICHFPNADAAFADVIADARAILLARHFWPGPLTLVLPHRPTSPISAAATAALDSLAVRVPAHPIAQILLQQVARPIAAPSANRSGRISPTSPADVHAELDGRIAAILHSGPSIVGLESTVLDLSHPHAIPRLLRPGAITQAAIEALIGPISLIFAPSPSQTSPILRSPGLLASHYAPTLPVRLNATDIACHEALLAFGANPPHAALTLNLSPTANLHEAASNLFNHLRRLDHDAPPQGLTAIAVSPIPRHDIGTAINDRLSRAAAPRQ